jgi:integral membrane protein
MTNSLRWYRAMALVVGVMLLIFCGFIVARHAFGVAAEAEMVVAQIHGLLYIGYLVTVALVVKDYRPKGGRIVLMILSGIIPIMAFIVERSTVADLAAQGPRSAAAQ